MTAASIANSSKSVQCMDRLQSPPPVFCTVSELESRDTRPYDVWLDISVISPASFFTTMLLQHSGCHSSNIFFTNLWIFSAKFAAHFRFSILHVYYKLIDPLALRQRTDQFNSLSSIFEHSSPNRAAQVSNCSLSCSCHHSSVHAGHTY